MVLKIQTELSNNHNLSTQTETFSRMYDAWYQHCGLTLNTLSNLRHKCIHESESVSNWVLTIGDAAVAGDLIYDLKEMSKKVPFNEGLVDMTDQVIMWFRVCPENHQLRHLFTD